ncbi:MAG: hypothetical protein ACOY81_11475 [Bacillota bacterium]|jgi:hypothetical protein
MHPAYERFMAMVMSQLEINQISHGDKDKNNSPATWAMIIGEHMGHLHGALLAGDYYKVEREIFHIAAPLADLFKSLTSK